jgi:tetratricopeptide (TPR) repeat protein
MRGGTAAWSGVLGAMATALGLCASACASKAEVVELPPMRFAVVGERVEALDAEALYSEATRAYDAGSFELAAGKYGLIADRFPESRYGAVAAFNAGLALEKAARFDEAVPRYEQAVRQARRAGDADDALLRLAACHEAREDWGAMREAGKRLLGVDDGARLSVANRLAALAIRGRGAEGTGSLALAERDYRAALGLYQDNLGDAALAQSPFVSLSQLRIAEIYRTLFASIGFRLPLSRMERDLEDKSNFFLMAQNAYLRTLRLRHADFATLAGYRLGLLYEVMHDDLMSAEVPSDLTREEVEVYYEELRAQVKPLLERAVEIYERNLRLGQRFGRDDAWIRKTEASLARLRDLIRADAGRDALQAIDRIER